MTTGGFIYAIGAVGTSYVKIGSTRTSVETRLKQLQTGQPFPLQVLATAPVETHRSTIEKHIHTFLQAEQQRGEWFVVQVDQGQLEAMIVRAVQWIAEEARKVAAKAARRPVQRNPRTPMGERLHRACLAQGLSRRQLAMQVGLSANSISAIETGQIDPRVEVVRRIAKALGVKFLYLVGEDEDSELLPAAVA